MQTPLSRLQVATKIHFYLLRELGQGIDVEQMLRQDLYARDVLLVCAACESPELTKLADQFKRLHRDAAKPASAPGNPPAAPRPAASATGHSAPGHTPAPLAWSRDTSGFSLSRPTAEAALAAPARRAGWLARWRDARG